MVGGGLGLGVLPQHDDAARLDGEGRPGERAGSSSAVAPAVSMTTPQAAEYSSGGSVTSTAASPPLK